MARDCDHEKTTITTDSGEREVCLICDDVSVETVGSEMGAEE
jgi:hypothetical protein